MTNQNDLIKMLYDAAKLHGAFRDEPGAILAEEVRRAFPSIFKEEMSGDKIIKINGKTFRCECGCNVFRSPVKKPKTYICNSCFVEYEGE